jgi:glutaminyl-tRNA synthetase
MNLNFGYPKKSGGVTYLRFDDTNPEAEKLEYIESIIDVGNACKVINH